MHKYTLSKNSLGCTVFVKKLLTNSVELQIWFYKCLTCTINYK